MKYPDRYYIGSWRKNKKHGFGQESFNGDLYEGQFENGKPHGEGRL